MNFQIIHVGAVGVNFRADGVPRAMNEVITESGFLDLLADDAVDFPSSDRLSGGNRILNLFYAGIPRVADDGEDFLHTRGWSTADESGPRNVIVDRVRCVLLCPYIEQHEIAFADWGRFLGIRSVVRIATVTIHCNHRRI